MLFFGQSLGPKRQFQVSGKQSKNLPVLKIQTKTKSIREQKLSKNQNSNIKIKTETKNNNRNSGQHSNSSPGMMDHNIPNISLKTGNKREANDENTNGQPPSKTFRSLQRDFTQIINQGGQDTLVLPAEATLFDEIKNKLLPAAYENFVRICAGYTAEAFTRTDCVSLTRKLQFVLKREGVTGTAER